MYINLVALFESLKGTPTPQRLERLLGLSGCESYEPGLFKSLSGGIALIGGLPITNTDPLEVNGVAMTPKQIRNGFCIARGIGGFFTYLNPHDRSAQELCALQNDHGHFSTAHLCTVSIALFGLTSAVEHKFDCQRDLLHLSRLTVSHTQAQSHPPFFVRIPKHLNAYRTLRQATATIRNELDPADADELESANNLWSKNAATAVLLTGSLRNWQHVIKNGGNDKGKEREYRDALAMIEAWLWQLDREMFDPPVYATCIIIENAEGKVLCIRRLKNGVGIAIIAGKVDPGETPEQAACREAFEEAGIKVNPNNLQPVFDGVCTRHRVKAFRAKHWEGTPVSSHEGEVSWEDWSTVLGTEGAFRAYNQALYNSLYGSSP